MSPSRRGSFRFGGIFPPHLVTPLCFASSIAALIFPMVSVSLLGMMKEQLYLGSEPFTLCRLKDVDEGRADLSGNDFRCHNMTSLFSYGLSLKSPAASA